MIELTDTSPDIDVQLPEYLRLLGYPRDWSPEGRSRELTEWARDWYAAHGHPWVYAREAGADALGGFRSSRLHRMFRDAEAHAGVLVAVSAGPELEREALKLWQEEKPDEYFFLEVYGSAVVEHLVTVTGARLCAWAESEQLAVLPHYSPGYPEWDVSDQPQLLELIGRPRLPAPLETLASGTLRPKKSLLAVFGLTRHVDRVRRLTELVPCENCSYLKCQYRRMPYGGVELPRTYTVNTRALKKWAGERLSIETAADGAVQARFRFDGTTCTNMGRSLVFEYQVKLGPREQGFPILEQRCGPAPGDTGHQFMCRYLDDAERLMAAIEREKPLLGRRLEDVLSWQRTACAAGCYCDAESREHKWGLVLETIHYALARGNS